MKYKIIIYFITFTAIFYLSACTGSLFQKNAEFENKTWILQSFNYEDVKNPDGKISILFGKEEKKLNGFVGCNTLYGSYSITGSDIKIKPGRTKMACDDMQIEEKLMKLLETTTEFREITSSGTDYLRLITPGGESIEFKLKK